MASRWIDRVRERGTLTVYKHESMTGQLWRGLFAQGISDFNALSQRHRLGVRLVTSEEQPTERRHGGADIMVSASDGDIPNGYPGSSQTRSFDGTGLHGYTAMLSISYGSGSPSVLKCFVHVPTNPQVRVGATRQRQGGRPVALCILVHEFIHCCGLSNADHVPLGTGTGIFCGRGDIVQGQTPEQDGMRPWGTSANPMPPINLDQSTANTIRSLWRTPSSSEQQPASPARDGRQGRRSLGRDVTYASLTSPAASNRQIFGRSWRSPGPQGRMG